ncbi:MAG: LmeA family phospholipid-binding protein [Mycobacterium sp.]
MTNPQGPPDDDPSTWAHPESQSAGAQPTVPSDQSGSAPTVPGYPGAPPSSPAPNVQDYPAESPSDRPPSEDGTTSVGLPVKTKRRSFQFFKDPLSIVLTLVIVVALAVAGLIGAELYARHVADGKVAEAVECEVKDTATVSFGVAPPVLWQHITGHYTNISVQTAGNQIRDAKHMKVAIEIRDVDLQHHTADSKGMIGALDATIMWSVDGIKESVQEAIPVLGSFVASTVSTHPDSGTIELRGFLDTIVVKPQIVENGLSLEVVSLQALGTALPRETIQASLDDFASRLTKDYPLGIHADSVQVTNGGVTAHFSTRDASMPAGQSNACFANL